MQKPRGDEPSGYDYLSMLDLVDRDFLVGTGLPACVTREEFFVTGGPVFLVLVLVSDGRGVGDAFGRMRSGLVFLNCLK